MKATNFLWDEPSLAGAWTRLTHALIFDPLRRDSGPENQPARITKTPPGGIFERIDRWFWHQHMRDREAYLAGAQDICGGSSARSAAVTTDGEVCSPG